jgi:3-oxoacyl-[acyl-carrier-protein] synthase II
MDRRIAITGLGTVSALGVGIAPLWEGLLAGTSGLKRITSFDPSGFPSRLAGEATAFSGARDFVPKSYRKAVKVMARDIELAVAAAKLAVEDAGLTTRGTLPEDSTAATTYPGPRMGCHIGAGLIAAETNELTMAMATAATGSPERPAVDLKKWGNAPEGGGGMNNLTPLWLLKYLPNMLACHVSIIHDTQGPSNTITCGQASAGLSLAEAARSIERGHAEMALVGGCESKINPMAIMRWSLLHRLVTGHNDAPATACRPLDAAACGTVLSEGGAVLVVEELEHAKSRGATIYAELAGFGSTSNGSYVIEPDSTGDAIAAGIRKALRDAQISPDSVQLVIPASCGAPAFDRADAAALKLAFGPALAKSTVAPLRGGIGDCGAGSQALDLVGATLALHSQTIPPAVNCPNPLDNLNVPQSKKSATLDHAVVIGSALGGQNSVIVLKRYS